MADNTFNKVILANSKAAAPIYIDRSGSAYDGLSLVAQAICDDICALSGKTPEVVTKEPQSGTYILAGVISDEYVRMQSSDWHISESGGDFRSEQWERYEIKVIKEQKRTKVVVAGSDKRGVYYGLFHITQDIFGVSPWIWWADVKPERRQELSVDISELETVSKRPSVSFRGFFMNDENPCLNGFADSHFGGLNYMFYDEIFKLILRLKGNYMWPAMWSNNFSCDGVEGVYRVHSVKDNERFKELEKKYHHKLGGLMYCDTHPGENIPEDFPNTNINAPHDRIIKPGEYPMSLANAVLADRYGITVGASHHEPMARSGGEWGMLQGYWSKNITYRDPEIPTDEGQKVWNYIYNPKNIEAFWSDGIYRNGGFNNLLTIGMRGENDSILIDAKGKTLDTADNIELLKAVLKTQYKILKEHGVQKTPLLLAVYKEVENCWYGGTRADPEAAKGKGLRDDPEVAGLLGADTGRIVMLCEDNNGYLRTLPELGQKDEYNWGLYYHFDYVGSPKTSMWINTMPLQRSWENLTQAYEYGIDDAWIVNVGDLRPMELPLSYFMDLAYDFDKYGISNPNNTEGYIRNWTREVFGAEHALAEGDMETIASLLEDYAWLNGVCKPETLKSEGDCSYSVLHYDAAADCLKLVNSIIKRANSLREKITKDSCRYEQFYQLVYYPAVASANVVRIQILSALNKLYAGRGSTVANKLSELVEKYLKLDEELTAEYNALGEDLNGVNKWYGMMIASPDYCRTYDDPIIGRVTAQAHMNYSSWNGVSAIKIEPEHVCAKPDGGMIVDVAGRQEGISNGTLTLPDFESSERQTYVINLTNSSDKPVKYRITPECGFLMTDGALEGEYTYAHSVSVRVDWSKVSYDCTASVKIESDDASVTVVAGVKIVDTSAKKDKTHFMSNGIAAINADGYFDKGDSCGVRWTKLDGYGKSKVSMKMLNTCTEPFEAGCGPWLDYAVKVPESGVPESGDYKLVLCVGQGNNVSFDHGTHLNVGVQLDGGEIKVVNIQGEGYISGVSGGWFASIEQGGRRVQTDVHLESGEHVLRIWGMDQNAVLQKFLIMPSRMPLYPSLIGPKATYDSSLGTPSDKDAPWLLPCDEELKGALDA